MWLLLAALLPADAGNEEMKVIAARQRREGTLAVGDVAPDAPLVTPDGSPTTLLSQRKEGRPLVLVFGSFT